jgi:hypothetical protein
MNRLERLIQGGLLGLLALMPFHAFLSLWLGSLAGHQAVIQSWKEVLLVLLGGLSATLVVRQPKRLQRLRAPGVWALIGFVALALVVTAVTRPPVLTALFGFKTDIEFILAALIAALVSSPALIRRAVTVTLAAGAGVVGFGLCQIYLLPPGWLTHFGYGPDTIAPFQVLDPAVQSLRFGSTLGGPNQLGAYLAIIIALSLAVAVRRRQWWLLALTAGAVPVLIHTYSRAAWIGALLAATITGFGLMTPHWRRVGLIAMTLLALVGLLLSSHLLQDQKLQYYLLHGNAQFHDQRGSDFEHLASLQSGVSSVLAAPWGHGLGTAGPTVFHTGTGRIIEDYYLQLGYEAGVVGMLLFIIALSLVSWRLLRQRTAQPHATALAGATLGISVNALVLPAWTDSTTCLVCWILIGLILAAQPPEAHHV